MSAVIEMRGIGKRFGKRPVIADFDLTVNRGEVVGLLGQSGIGKSTILRMVAGLEKPDAGRLRVHSDHMGFVFQEDRLLPWDTALDNVALPLRALGMGRREAHAHARSYLRRMELSGFEQAYPHELSGGMRQRVSLARALAVSPDILLLDEPFTGLDRDLKEAMRGLLESALEPGRTAVLHVTHDPGELLGRTSRIITLERREPEASGERSATAEEKPSLA